MINDAKGSNGMFSQIGKHSSEKYHILSKKEEIMSGLTKRLKIKDMFSSEENKVKVLLLD